MDGIFIKVHKGQEDALNSICEWWEEISKVKLERQTFQSLYFLNTADYFGLDNKGELKEKGMFQSQVALGKGMEFPIIAKSVKEYFLKGVPIEKTIREANDILLFCSYKKLNRDTECWYNGKVIQRVNRFYASKVGAYIYRKSIDGKGNLQHLLKESPVIIYNKFNDVSIEMRNINYGFYQHSARNIISEIEQKQLNLF